MRLEARLRSRPRNFRIVIEFGPGLEDSERVVGKAVRMSKWLPFCVVVVLSAQAGRSRARADDDPASDVARAEDYAAQAFEAYSREDYVQAVSLYRVALEAAASPDILYNLARIYDGKLKDRAAAISFYQRYTTDPGADPDRVRIAMQRIAILHEPEGTNPDSTHVPGAAANDEAKGPTAESGASRKTAEKARSGITGLQIASLLVGSVGVAGVGVGIGFGIDAKTNADVSHDLCTGNLCSTPRGVNAARDASSSARISTIAFVAGGALIAGGVTMLILSSTGSGEREASAQLVPYADRYGGGTQLIGRW
jgi:hypothetical protein